MPEAQRDSYAVQRNKALTLELLGRYDDAQELLEKSNQLCLLATGNPQPSAVIFMLTSLSLAYLMGTPDDSSVVGDAPATEMPALSTASGCSPTARRRRPKRVR